MPPNPTTKELDEKADATVKAAKNLGESATNVFERTNDEKGKKYAAGLIDVKAPNPTNKQVVPPSNASKPTEVAPEKTVELDDSSNNTRRGPGR